MKKGNIKKKETDVISRKEALKIIGNYGRYAALTALGTYLILHPQKAQAASASARHVPPPPKGYDW